jgi:hypothetical protein
MVMAMDFCVPDDTGSLSAAASSAPQVIELIARTISLLEAVQDHYEQNPGIVEDQLATIGSLDSIGAEISTVIAAQEIRDLAFVANGQIKSCLKRLERAVETDNVVNTVAGCDDAVSRLRKGLIPLEAILSDFEGASHPDRQWIDMELLLRTRRLYGQLRRELMALGEPRDQELVLRLSELARRIIRLRLDEIYIHLRISDRVQIRALLKRIESWLASEQRSLKTGRVIWSELRTFVNLLAQINNRQELHEHDRDVIGRVYQALYRGTRPPAVIPAAVLDELRSLEGLDDELDSLILHSSSEHAEDWQGPLQRLWQASQNGDPTLPAALDRS